MKKILILCFLFVMMGIKSVWSIDVFTLCYMGAQSCWDSYNTAVLTRDRNQCENLIRAAQAIYPVVGFTPGQITWVSKWMRNCCEAGLQGTKLYTREQLVQFCLQRVGR